MSDKDIKQEKVMTKYDRKMQRRQAEKEKEQRQKKITTAVGIVIAVALVAWIASFPIRNYLATHETFIIINNENITKAEFDLNYYNVLSQYSSFLGYFGVDASQDLSSQMYTDTLSWKDYLEEMAVDGMKRTKALKADADAAGYTYDASKEVTEFKDALKASAKSAGISTNKYLKQVYGPYASMNSVTRYIEENARVNAYYEKLSEDLQPTEDEIMEYYRENSDDYDFVDYYVSTFSAEFPEDLSDEEIEAALDKAFEQASAAEVNIMSEGDEQKNVKKNAAPSAISDWLFDASRAEGDTTVIEDADNYTYYAVGFVQRNRDETPLANVRVIMTQDMDGQAILEEWGAGAATEDSFAELADKYNAEDGVIPEGGLYEELTKDSSNINSDMADWIFAYNRKEGDTGYVTTEEGDTYVMYYAKQLDPEWKQDIKDTLLDQLREEYVDNLVESVILEDPKGNLNYLKVQEAEEAAVSDGDVSDSDIEDVENADDIENVEDGVSDGDMSEN